MDFRSQNKYSHFKQTSALFIFTILQERELKKQTVCCRKSVNKIWRSESSRDRRQKGLRISEQRLTCPCLWWQHFVILNCVTLMEDLWLQVTAGTLDQHGAPALCPKTTSLINCGIFYSEPRSILRIHLSTGSRDYHNWQNKAGSGDQTYLPSRMSFSGCRVVTPSAPPAQGPTPSWCLQPLVLSMLTLNYIERKWSWSSWQLFHVITCQVCLLMYLCDAQEISVLLLAAPSRLVPR